MPIPESVAEADIARWEKDFQERDTKDKEEQSASFILSVMPNFPIPDKREVFYSGHWLGEQIRNIGGTDEEVESVCGSCGQKCFFAVLIGKDCWELAQESLEEFVAGTWDPPGMELAKKLNELYLKIFIENHKARN